MNADEPLWECVKCRESDEIHQELVEHAVERVVELGSATEVDDSLKKVVVKDPSNGRQRVVFVPASILLDSEAEVEEVKDEEMDPNCTTIVVPRNPEALEQIGDDVAEWANSNKKKLERLAEFFGMPHFPAAQRRGNGYYFAASKDDCGCQLLQLRGNSSVICRTYSRHLHIWFDQQRGNMLRFSLCSR